jgi:hypothetical protein
VIDHRRLQRALFRMQLDPGCSPADELGPAERALLAAAHPAGLTADPGGRRRAQFLRNVTSEFSVSLAVTKGAALVERFTSSPEFHAAVASDSSLPLAFADYLARVEPGPLAALDGALARARRARHAPAALAPGDLVLAPWAELLELPSGTLAAAERVRGALDAGQPTPIGVAISGAGRETLLLRRDPEPAPFRLASVEVERLSPELATLLARARQPIGRARRQHEARSAGLTLPEYNEIVADLTADRILIAHPPPGD